MIYYNVHSMMLLITGALLRSIILPATDAVTVMAGGGGVASFSVFWHPQTIPINVTINSKEVLLFRYNVFILMLSYFFDTFYLDLEFH